MKMKLLPFGFVFMIIIALVLSSCQPGGSQVTQTKAPVQTSEAVVTNPTIPATESLKPTETTISTITPTSATPPPSVSIDGQTWELLSYLDASNEIKSLLPDTKITASFENGQLAGNSGCNQYFGSYQTDSDQISIQNVGGTLIACLSPEGVMVQEQAYLNRLQEPAKFKIEGDQLLLFDTAGTIILTYQIEKPTSLTGTVWQLQSYRKGENAVVSPLPGASPTAEFRTEGTLSGSAGCNQYDAAFTLNGQQLTILAPASTRKTCSEPVGVMEQETEYLNLLVEVVSYRIDGEILNLLSASQQPILTYSEQQEPAEVQGVQSTPLQSDQASLGVDSLKNMEYKNGFTASGRAPLTNGEYREPAAPGSASETAVRLMDQFAYGELPDGKLAVADILTTDSGGSGTFFELAVVVDLNGEPLNIATTFLGDRVKINSIQFEDGDILVDMVKQGPEDPMCCPTQHVLQRYQLENTALVLVSSEVIK